MSDFQDNDVVIVSSARTPIGRARKGSLIDVRPEDLLVTAARGAIERAGNVTTADFDDFHVGCAEPDGESGDNIARRVAILLGDDTLPGTTITRFCASSIQATRMAFHAIRAGEGNAYLIGGVEQVSRSTPNQATKHPTFADAPARVETQLGGDTWVDPRESGLLPDYYIAMGHTAEFVARKTGTSRADQDAWALQSQTRAGAAITSGYFAEEIVSVTLADGTVVETDDSPRPGTTAEALAGLAPVFIPNGTVTAGNACPLNDGASALVVTSGAFARERGLTPLAKIRSTAVSALSPEIMGLGPVASSKIALERAGISASDLGAVELNEAFAAQVVPSIRELGLDPAIVNPHGGAIALGHPFGATGARMLGTLAHELTLLDRELGLATLCVGGGQGMAVVLERVGN
ncbi:acetyl-CoA C-acyltransferase [Gulosibacter molinativorax]|uniref:acetyl-CoA C-acyltransferase n=1 Tax=Gulosibacter molinativorax TaxID=256821 RepID=UPI0003FD21A9|nr:acetyl-CoA C-acyltransferase [Gulosibacter molinativorax]QUY61943.1 3-ketoacyl-CoA thiolase [Gulosibacter molinativorax]